MDELMSRRIALSALIAVALVGGLVLFVASAYVSEPFDPAPEFGVLIANPCPTAIEFYAYADLDSGGTSKADRTITIEGESTKSFLWGLFDGDLVVSAPSLPWESRVPAPDRGYQLVYVLEAEACP